MKCRKAIFGGSFNPVHLGHLLIAQDAADHFELSQVLFVPCSEPAHKDPGTLAPSDDRLEMVKLAVAGNPRFEASSIEVDRSGTSYSIDTVTQLCREQPEVEWFFIIGQDSLYELHTWRRVEDLLESCSFITLARPGTAAAGFSESALRLPFKWVEKLQANFMEMRQVDISSTEIRARIHEGKSADYMVPEVVGDYMLEHQLYRSQKEKASSTA